MLNYLPEARSVDRVFQALADANRRAIIEMLSAGPASVSELARPLPMSLSAVVQHLSILEASGLVSSEKTGRVRTCHLDLKTLDSAQHWMDERRTAWHRRFDRLGELLNDPEPKPAGPQTQGVRP